MVSLQGCFWALVSCWYIGALSFFISLLIVMYVLRFKSVDFFVVFALSYWFIFVVYLLVFGFVFSIIIYTGYDCGECVFQLLPNNSILILLFIAYGSSLAFFCRRYLVNIGIARRVFVMSSLITLGIFNSLVYLLL